MREDIMDRAMEIIGNAYEEGLLQDGSSWEDLDPTNPYSEMHEGVMYLARTFKIAPNVAMRYLKTAYENYMSDMDNDDDEIMESKNNTNMAKVTISESKLYSVISEAIARRLNESIDELTSTYLNNAANAAWEKKRTGQAMNFMKGRNSALGDETKAVNLGDNVDQTWDHIRYRNSIGNMVSIDRSGSYTYDGGAASNTIQDKYQNFGRIPDVLRTDDKRLARVIASWTQKVMSDETKAQIPELADWHNWCRL